MAYPRSQRSRNFKFITLGPTASVTSTSFAAVTGLSDITVSAQAGDVIESAPLLRWNSEAASARAALAIVVAGSVVRYIGDTTYGIGAWYGPPSVFADIGPPVLFTLTNADLASGTVSVRFVAKVDAASTRTIQGGSEVGQFWVKNIGPQDTT